MQQRSRMRRIAGMMARRESEVWLYSYADLITNLLAFFILLFAMSKMDQKQILVVQDSIKRATQKPFGESNNPDKKFAAIVSNMIREKNLKNTAAFTRTVDGVAITFAGGLFFETLSADLSRDGMKALDTIAPFFLELPKEMRIDIAGHSDVQRITDDSLYASNWELSASRAAAVVRYLITRGVPPTKLRAIGYADTQPVSQDLSQNRRVVIKIGKGLAR